jgi:nicotinate-nucleotide pyrophosphorylase (carboxylating)
MDARRLLADPWLDTLLTHALSEDVGSGDASSAITVTGDLRAEAHVIVREAGVVAGLVLLEPLVRKLDPALVVELAVDDGARVAPGQRVASLRGAAAPLLTVERTALNLLQQLSGIASLTASYVDAVAGTGCQVLDTRKTVPGYRKLAKYAVRCGGGTNHRLGLDDRIMLKDNHWAAGGHGIEDLIARGRQRYPDLAIEVEVDHLDQFDRVLPLGAEWILLDNLAPEEAARAVARRDATGSTTRLEASGNVTLETIGAFARAGVDAASVGRLTHSAPALDLGIDMEIVS